MPQVAWPWAYCLKPLEVENTLYKKSFGRWGETSVDNWMNFHGWETYRKNLKMRHGEIDRVYVSISPLNKEKLFCVSEIKTIYCKNREKFFSFFTEIGLSALIKQNQIRNLYKYAEHISAFKTNSNRTKIFIRFFIVLKMYDNYEKEFFFQSQNTYKICRQTKNEFILSFIPHLK